MNRRRLGMWLTFLCWVGCSVCAGVEQPNNRWAILIGINDYFEVRDLQYCVSDQRALRKQLIRSGFSDKRIFLLCDEAQDKRFLPTKRNIEKQLELVLRLVDKGDLVFVAFSGHGYHVAGDSYLCPVDGELERPDSLLPTEDVYDLLKDCPASLKVMLVDACRNDPHLGGARTMRASPGTRALARSFQESTPEGIVLLNSCSPGEISWEEDEFGHGVFMHFVLDALRGAGDRNSDQRVSLAELARYANEQTKLYVAHRFSKSQRPFITNESTLDALDFGLTCEPAEEITNSIGMKLQLMPAGEFMMGSPASESKRGDDEGPQHRVQIIRPFYLGAYEVTQHEYEQVMGSNPSYFSSSDDSKERVTGLDTDRFPVERVSWNNAVEFCQKLSAREGKTYRLPTEAEWEYACRAGTTTPFHFGSVLNGKQANANGNYPYGTDRKGPYLHRTTQVGSYSPNVFGLYDMHGNVWEWCQDWYGEDYYQASPSSDPTGPTSGSSRILRGGSWRHSPVHVRSAYRSRYTPRSRGSSNGFRVVRELE